jgi:Putative prokaryotic signal transducing protein
MSDFDHSEPNGLELVFKSIDPVSVRMACDFLQQGGIEAFIFDNEAARMLGSTSAVEARLMVPADRLAEARLRLKQLGFT